jgi:hypothetical protein
MMSQMRIEIISDNAPEMEFQFLTGDVDWETYGGKWISEKLNNGDFDYWLILEFINWIEATGESYDGDEFLVEITAVSPEEAGQDNIDSALQGYDINDPNDLMIVEALSSYGISAHMWRESGNDADALLHKAKQAALVVASMFGFFMDRPQNRIGASGWEVIGGDLMGSLFREYMDK